MLFRWQILLHAARLYEATADGRAEQFYELAKSSAFQQFGADSASYGCVLLAYAEFLHRNARNSESSLLEKQARHILCNYVLSKRWAM